MDPKYHHNQRRRRCILTAAASLLILCILILVLALTVLRPRHAVTTVNSVKVAGLRVGLNVPNLAVDLNLTLDLDLTATNPNHVGFKYRDGSAELYYRGELVGVAVIPAGEVASEGSVRTDVKLTLMVGKLSSTTSLYGDVVAGVVSFTTTTMLPGSVTILGVFRFPMISSTTCDVSVSVRDRSVTNSDCKYKTKL